MKASGNNPEVFFAYSCFRKIIKEEITIFRMGLLYLSQNCEEARAMAEQKTIGLHGESLLGPIQRTKRKTTPRKIRTKKRKSLTKI